MNIPEVCRLARNLAKNCGYATFPCNAGKSPTCTNGFKDASTDPAAIDDLWRRWPAPLIGVATGERSDLAVLDVDTYRPAAAAWLAANNYRLPRTLSYETRRGGCHLYYRHTLGLRCNTGQLAPGVDIRADGGYVIHWFSAGYPSLSTRAIEPWPAWLMPKPPPAPAVPLRQTGESCTDDRIEAYIGSLLARISSATEGTKHDTLLRCSRAIGGVIAAAGISVDLAHQRISNALMLNPSRVANWQGAYRTITDGLADGMAHPFTLADRPYDRWTAA